MALFYLDNDRRASRAQQLVDSIADMQAEIKRSARRMDEMNIELRPTINALLTANNHQSVDDLINKASAQMTPAERKKFETLIDKFRRTKTNFGITETLAGLLTATGGMGLAITGQMALSIAHFCWQTIAVNMAAQICGAFTRGTETVAQVMATFESEAEDVLFLLEGFDAEVASGEAAAAGGVTLVSEAGLAGEAVLAGETALANEVAMAAGGASRLASLGAIRTFSKFVSSIGFAVLVATTVFDYFQAKSRKEDLVNAIHSLQPLRLTTALCREQMSNVMMTFQLLLAYLNALHGPKSDRGQADTIARIIVETISKKQSAIDLDKLESDLEAQDRLWGGYYGDEDLSHAKVVAAVREAEHERC